MMRKVLGVAVVVCLLLTLQAIAFAAPPVEGFMGVPWGAGRDQVDKAMAEQGFVKLAKPDWCASVPGNALCDPGLVNYDGRFAGERAEIRFLFQNKALYEGWVALFASETIYLQDQVNAYTRMKALLTEKYGPPSTDNKTIRPKGWGQSARATWALTSGDSGDQIELVVLMEGVFLYDAKRPQAGYVHVFYINRSLEKRMKTSNI